ncbi:uncharacterized protein LOC132905710 isoform X2 [Bombus pascuorum]|nr:uncharacterized protein LOC132905710 isoform X2 [Bombus pascuorum]XP_060813290.1 uncharacterized protein LOC132905710 isoform X2 [Bombus pascuorum]
MGVCADHFLPEMFKPNLTENTNKKKKLKKNAISEPPKNLLINEEKEDVQASQLVIKQQLMREEGEEEKERHQHHHYHYQQQQEAEEREVEKEGENELFINKPTLNYTKVPLKFSDKENSMECLAVEPQTNCDVQLENWTRKTFREMKLKKECAQLLKKNEDLRVQIKYVKRNLEKVKRSRDRFREMLRTVETSDEFFDRHGCENDAARALVKSQLKSESIKYTTEKRDECEESN